ncbi:hypothetical protein M422DRAFT_39302 [Sphaerobolus stellatus SS14]|uniref:Uncharacterized protein n=1 Tax=Sphaerobolus stellatus (strain SS14) TaxID=990650 RepID=A0A0C9TN27_SPHS4|nr:hypothetical protein M422DRAFT_39694 [Sphaerobolus stellatus SS14]KIJ24064.1 hypothetical protein M422DRAFT_39302 [Sphaerobolus stellatus SS14]
MSHPPSPLQMSHRRTASTDTDGNVSFVNEEDTNASPTRPRLNESPSRRKIFIRKIRTSIFKRKDEDDDVRTTSSLM